MQDRIKWRAFFIYDDGGGDTNAIKASKQKIKQKT
jgi:hypothetical protein